MPFTDAPNFDTSYDDWMPSLEEIDLVSAEAALIHQVIESAGVVDPAILGDIDIRDRVFTGYIEQLQYALEQLGGQHKAFQAFKRSRWSAVALPSEKVWNGGPHYPHVIRFQVEDLPILRRLLQERDGRTAAISTEPTSKNSYADSVLDREIANPVDLAKVIGLTVLDVIAFSFSPAERINSLHTSVQDKVSAARGWWSEL